jgi:riboflavin kinase/FMN adenylyltransferase
VVDLLTDRHLKAAQRARIVPFSQAEGLGEVVCTFGVFDGFHRGHQFLIEQACAEAQRRGTAHIVVTFDRDPDEFFLPQERWRKLLTNAERLAYLATAPVDAVLVLPFDEVLAMREPADFLDHVFGSCCTPRAIFVGEDFRFGHRAIGTVDDLHTWGAGVGCDVSPQALLADDDTPVTATRVRNALQAAQLEEANHLLTRPYYVRAHVVPGRRVGHELGFPTANIVIEDSLVRPADGVYAGYVFLDDLPCKAAISIGVPATFMGVEATIEAHLIDFEGALYGREVKVAFIEYLRPMYAFSSVEELVQTVQSNIAYVRQLLV